MGYFRGLKLENGIWQYRFVLNGVLYRGSTKCSEDKEAIKWLNHYKSKISLGDVGVRNPPTLETLCLIIGEPQPKEQRPLLGQLRGL